ncbi:hypothetical protein EHQ12_15205 [Leptospira gomenensis]|uniref:Uncharacterized protein n=1 Tax=Leptospira gomenensis TaxID=2484974 RepID=A0A5F1YGJ1_9LEPT|nr:hypothetical protein EHQ12_15205 [Leptospira gomenensis]TGK39234.1 hypothetical protein EHQ17_00255 [Leptospira gomenensis]TGK48904.1 hypothetical protein EHQ07_05005 [Leptospira gomenensis]TGK54614.1 hypothetical protein EHQ13_18975 [Leptospira gomenensis]
MNPKTVYSELRNLILVAAIIVCAILLSSCRTLESFFETIVLTGGVDSTRLSFSTKYSPVQEFIRSNGGTKEPANPDRAVNQDPFKSVPFYTLGSIPRRLSSTPFTGYLKFLNFVAYGFTVTAPRTFRGNLTNFPDDGRIPSNFTEHVLYGLYPLPEPFGRKAEYLYVDYQVYTTLYLLFLGLQNWNLGLGLNFGFSVYDFDVLERELRVSSTRNKSRMITGVKFLYEYNIGQYFEDSIFYNTYLYFEFSSLGTVDRDPIKQTIPTSVGSVPDLYLTMDTFRVGVRKEIQLSRPTSEDLLRGDSSPGNPSSPSKQTDPVPPRL